MKLLLFGLAFIVAINADVSHLRQNSGYNYPEPHPSFHDELSLPIAPKPAPAPSKEYLPPVQKPKVIPPLAPRPTAPKSQYLPPAPTSKPFSLPTQRSTPKPLSREYLPPVSPASKPAPAGQTPKQQYLPPAPKSKSFPTLSQLPTLRTTQRPAPILAAASATASNPKQQYLPPKPISVKISPSRATPKPFVKEYLPPPAPKFPARPPSADYTEPAATFDQQNGYSYKQPSVAF